ncbi:transporter substrate-binding domain-containing protein [Chitinimonas taiwanensis]|jgi:arginine/ornithine transport system substrate-binding protein|uniref:Amino acid ABC transporter substrate-binding protein, PAAT family (TC 3.A.1.3.-) n=1 Tax=Chitinimonas taiwanensis DSM 18899 TaxID=1121279 RepID=A0A1K2HM69_9NEIS|nr:transporter substrate-binding domain-containing protein [Chitinimonas taiwanensis]SFZ77863.1 amino acid ABC transporter substrate-binding protein, PAAT family (TC 3.A.1.3.-) [Chitinimonas taiwanensis DSM 18899]
MKSLILALPLLLTLTLGQAHAADEIRIAMEGKFPPFEDMDANGNLRGFNVDIANALCAEMKLKCKLVRFEWDDLIPALNDKKTDAILASMSITQERLKLVDFTDKYAQTPAFFFAKSHRIPFVFINPKRLAGMKIGVQVDTTYDRYVSAKYAATSPITRFKSTEEMYNALADGQIDLVMDDAVAGYYGFLQTPRGKGFELVGSAVVDVKYFGEGQGIAVRKGDKELKAKFNKALATILVNGVYKDIQRKYFVFNVY